MWDWAVSAEQTAVETILSVCFISKTLKPKDWEMNFMGQVKKRQMDSLVFSIWQECAG